MLAAIAFFVTRLLFLGENGMPLFWCAMIGTALTAARDGGDH